MKYGIMTAMAAAILIHGGALAVAEQTPIFSDAFESPQLSSAWTVHEGDWAVQDGELINRDGGLITLSAPPGDRFAMDMDINLPNRWLSVIFSFTDPQSYDTIYLGGGYWESFTMDGEGIDNYVQHRDPDITTGVYHHVRIVYDYGRVSFYYDGKLKGHAAFYHRPGARVGFRTLKGSSVLKIKHVSLESIEAPTVNIMEALPSQAFAEGVMYRDHDLTGGLSNADRLTVDAETGEAALTYRFAPDDVFESHFVRVPVDAAACNGLIMDVEGDGSKNSFFIILHDASGEQHLAIRAPLAWEGWQTIEVDLTLYLQSPPNMQRLIVHWGGDESQSLDFPIKAIDIGVAKRETRIRNEGRIRFRNVRFVE